MKYVFSFILLCISFISLAQTPDLVKWTFQCTKEKGTNNYTVYAKALIENGWHVFAPDPGGDGLLIPTTVVLDHPELVKDLSELAIDGKVISKEMEGIGMVNYFEHEVTFKLNFKGEGLKTVDGMVSFQLCSDLMCLPPKDIKFNLKLEE